MIKNLKLLLMSLLLVAPMAFAQSNADGEEQTNSPKKTTLNFEDELVEGKRQKPELFFLLQQKNFNYKRLIKLRENFIPEMRRTAVDVQRVRGNN